MTATTIQVRPPTEDHSRLMLRVLRRVELRPHPEPGAGDCMVWTGAADAGGYGFLHEDGRRRLVHRLIVECVIGGEIPDGIVVHHACQVPACVNPLHLDLLTPEIHTRTHHWLRTRDEGWEPPADAVLPEDSWGALVLYGSGRL